MPVYSGTISGVAQNEIQLGAQQRAAAERQLAMLIQQQQAARNNAQQDRSMDRADSNDAVQRQQFDRTMTANELQQELARRERSREFDVTQRGRDSSAATQAKYYDWLMKQEPAADQKQYQSRLNGALMNAQTGKYGDWREVMDDFPDMHEQDAAVVLGQSHAARNQMQSQYDFANNAAGVLNKLTNLKQQLALKNKEVLKRGGFHSPFSSSPGLIYSSEADVAKVPGRYDADIPKITEEIGKLEPWAQRLQTDKRLDSLLQQDPESGKWLPTQRLPWAPTAPVTAPSAAPAQPASPAIDGPTATNPRTGERIILRNGTWQPLSQ